MNCVEEPGVPQFSAGLTRITGQIPPTSCGTLFTAAQAAAAAEKTEAPRRKILFSALIAVRAGLFRRRGLLSAEFPGRRLSK